MKDFTCASCKKKKHPTEGYVYIPRGGNIFKNKKDLFVCLECVRDDGLESLLLEGIGI